MKTYKLPDGRIIFAARVDKHDTYCTVTRKPTGSLRRYVNRQLPICDSLEKASLDLDNFASIRGMEVVTHETTNPHHP